MRYKDTDVAVKTFSKKLLTLRSLKMLKQEITTMHALNSKYLESLRPLLHIIFTI